MSSSSYRFTGERFQREPITPRVQSDRRQHVAHQPRAQAAAYPLREELPQGPRSRWRSSAVRREDRSPTSRREENPAPPPPPSRVRKVERDVVPDHTLIMVRGSLPMHTSRARQTPFNHQRCWLMHSSQPSQITLAKRTQRSIQGGAIVNTVVPTQTGEIPVDSASPTTMKCPTPSPSISRRVAAQASPGAIAKP